MLTIIKASVQHSATKNKSKNNKRFFKASGGLMMNKIAALSLFILVFISSCDKQKLALDEPTKSLNYLVEKTGGENLVGRINSFVTDSNEVGIKVDAGQAKRLFIIQKQQQNGPPPGIQLTKGQAVYLKHALVINSLEDNTVYYFGVKSKQEEKRIYKKVNAKLNISNVEKGFGLAKINITDFNRYDFKSKKSIYDELEANSSNKSLTELVEQCQSGGPGSTSCSSGECSVSCSQGSYACCNSVPESCKCVSPDSTEVNPQQASIFSLLWEFMRNSFIKMTTLF